MRIWILLILIISTSNLFANFGLNYYTPDTLKTPEGKNLTRKQKRLQGRAVQGRDFTLSIEKKKGDKVYKSLGYMEAADFYKDLEGVEMNEFVQGKLANSYRLNGLYEESEYWYSQMINETEAPEDFLNYALVLQSNGKCEDAVRWYTEYLTRTMDDKRQFITDCDQLEDFKISDAIAVKNLVDLNTENLDFSPIQYKGGIVFTSNRGINKLAVNQDKWTKASFTDIFYAKLNSDGSVKEIDVLDDDLNSKYHDGVTSFNSQGNFMLFSRSNKKSSGKNGIKDLKLYSSTNKENYWEEPIELNINGEDFASCHPTLTPDGRRVYFSSNRPGGYGGMDIWTSQFIGGKWQEPTNLGPVVNTGGMEIFPHLAIDESLYFASNGHRGIGGLDNFVVRKSNEDDETTWSIRENLGHPFNSKKDDFSFTMNTDKKSGYFTSNREGGLGDDDIYQWNGTLNEEIAQNNRRRICVYDEKSGQRLSDVDVTIIETAGQGTLLSAGSNDLFLKLKPLNAENKEFVLSLVEQNNELVDSRKAFTTSKDGNFRYTINPDRNYLMMVQNKSYENFKEEISGAQLYSKTEHCLALKKSNCILLNGEILNKKYNSLIPNAKIYLFNKCTGETIEEVSNENGEFDFCLECGCEYEVIGQKANFSEGRTVVSTLFSDCEGSIEKGIPLEAQIMLEVGSLNLSSTNPNGNNNPNGNGPTYIFATPDWANGNFPFPPTPENLNRYFTGTDKASFKKGQVIKLSNIYYDFDKSNIRTDAQREMNYVYQLLTTYPSMNIELLSHTDSRGNDEYNEGLAHRRAQSAMKYLVNRGININRLSYLGMGEKQPVNDCVDGVDCQEDKHQMNRRTEIKITQFNELGVEVQD